MKYLKQLRILVLLPLLVIIACSKDDDEPKVIDPVDETAPTVVSTSPDIDATAVARNKVITTFSESMSPASFTSTSFKVEQGSNVVTGSFEFSGSTVGFIPNANGGPNGDLYITFTISGHPDFKRLENDLYTTKELDLYSAILGGELTIDTLSGKVKLKVKPETQNGEKVKLKGKGFPVYKNEGVFGDLYVTYQVKIPTGLTDKQKELFTELSKT